MSLLEELKHYRESRTLEGRREEQTLEAESAVSADETNEVNEEIPDHAVAPGGRGDELNESNEVIPDLHPSGPDEPAPPSVGCRGCGADIPEGTTLCTKCSSAGSPVVQSAVELSELSQEASLRGRALVALDRRRYPRLELSKGRSVGPGLIRWCPVLRAADARTLRRIIELAERARTRHDDD